jgi:hypothetical protein
MRSTPKEAAEFDDAFEALQRKRGLGKRGINVDALTKLISSNLDAAHDYVIIQCAMTKVDPLHIQRAFAVAVLLGGMSGDSSLSDAVIKLAGELKLTNVLARMSTRQE